MKKIARIVIEGWPQTDVSQAEATLHEALLSIQEPVQFLTTPGGYVFLPLPDGWTESSGWNTPPDALSVLAIRAAPYIPQIITPRVMAAARSRVQYLTLSLDFRSLGVRPHAELVALIDLASGKVIGWTGKSYPTMDQERSLIHITDLSSHMYRVGGERVLVLGCHDLNVFNARARANQKVGGWRHSRCGAMLQLFEEFQPTIILQHPHATDTWKSWVQAWREVARRYPGAAWASAIAYAHPRAPREPLEDVLDRTHHAGDAAQNIVIPGRTNPTDLQKMVVPDVLYLHAALDL